MKSKGGNVKLILLDDCGFGYDIIYFEGQDPLSDAAFHNSLRAILNNKIKESNVKCDNTLKKFINEINATTFFEEEK